MAHHQNLNDLRPSDIVQPALLAEYDRRLGVFADDLTIAHTNLCILRQMRNFDAALFEAPAALLSYLGTNLIDQVLLILTRLWGDTSRGVMTMDKFATWLREKGVRPECRHSVASAIDQATPSPNLWNVIERCRKIRHARVAHLSAELRLRTTPVSVRLDEIECAANALGDLYNAMNFGATMEFVLIEFHCDDGRYDEGDFGYVLDRIALGSKWFSLPEKHPSIWPHFRETVTEEQLTKINELRCRYNMVPLL